MKKADLLQLIVERLADNLTVLEKAARASHTEATHESSKAESKYDTRGLEAAYLAGGQARQAREIQESIELYRNLPVRDFLPDDLIDLSALVELEMDGMRSFYFVGPKSGGLEIDYNGEELTVITPQSPLGQNLMGRAKGKRWTEKRNGVPVKYHIVSVL